MGKKVKITINGQSVEIEKGTSILDAAKQIGVIIPTLCYHKDLCVAGNCRVCIVEVVGQKRLAPACATPCEEGMDILTNTHKVRNSRKHIIELLLSEHNADCTSCYKNGNCELQLLASEYKIMNQDFIHLVPFRNYTIDDYSPSIIKDDSKCIRCQRCVRTCAELQSVNALTMAYKGEYAQVTTFFKKSMNDVICTNCGQCVNHCPTGALVEKNYIEEVWAAISDKDKYVVIQTAPAVRVGLGEELGFDPGSRSTGKMVAALKRLGFDSVMDTDFTADLTIMEEGTELLTRLKKALAGNDKTVKLPMTTSCSPGWIKFIEHLYPEFLDHLSSCKSPQQMFGALVKTYYAKARKMDPAKIVSVSVMPCTAKKFEAARPEMHDSGYRDVDYVLTTRELAIMIKQAGIDFKKLEDMHFDRLMGESTGAGVIFGVTGGVMEAALRTAYELVTGREVPFENLNITPVRGMEGVREARIKIDNPLKEWAFLDGVELKCAVAHGLVNAKYLMDKVKAGKADYHFIEFMACPGGCLGGGGQPIPTNPEIRQRRAEAIYAEDAGMPYRKSHENPEIIKIYKDFLGHPLSEVSHHLLHTKYTPRRL
ncbi:MAG: NADH-dependent [FeFe] hydrogenase, group A6 [Bacteroidales bacterium]|jgi:NADH-quinone oxidoreductase subunit G/[NiFe] hydrogenase diaphorase moiety small subunit/NADP-reducing hydrogenase subunit HndD|nr:NADH-dependent [FeFe] hydrogenase, group A6 [Bacteroidales bacterium]MDD2264946.1 NADH-dependent [FeFe] hydrogenase, group A6 [Bacteroidales bacterium]MDD2832114.1 NADH-dependent [FeFe] hydrogenase, group A6 [Bacteroidales bacterium]MDD3208766.1 NADH-dependent [FeFe] hydrogenase, group A6 [Bacteroidales bacterium]MDD3697329.1 NADH-dependent [FeFe] hydrogenase, group A6 [Bacteroidales bacterium]